MGQEAGVLTALVIDDALGTSEGSVLTSQHSEKGIFLSDWCFIVCKLLF